MDQTIRTQNKESYNQNSKYRDTKEIAEWKLPIFDGFVSYLADNKLTNLLDLGAGSGVCSQYFNNDDINIKCIDASDKMVELCLANGLDAEVMDFYNIEFEDQSFDAVWAMNSLLHVPKKSLSSVLEGISRILKKDGVFYMGVYGGESSEGIYEDDFYEPPRFFARYNDEELKTVLAKHFTILSFNHIDLDNDGFWFQSVYMTHK